MLIVSYGELEYQLSLLVGSVLGDNNQGIRLLFRVKGEDTRIELTDAIVRPKLSQSGLSDIFNDTIGAIRLCKTIRNQFAHSHWFSDDDGLSYYDLDAASKVREGDISLFLKPISADVLKLQANWFLYTSELINYLTARHDQVEGRLSNPLPRVPERVPRPPLNNLRPKQSDQNTGK